MKTYRIFFQITSTAYADIDAENVDEAMRLADEMDADKFTQTDKNWELDREYYEESDDE